MESGEELRGICAASQQRGMFKGGVVAIGVSDRRLLIQPLSRRGEPDGEVRSVRPDEVASARAGGAGGGWYTATAGILDEAAAKLEIRTTDGEKLKLMMMMGEGALLGKLGGGGSQQRGMEALAEWFRLIEP